LTIILLINQFFHEEETKTYQYQQYNINEEQHRESKKAGKNNANHIDRCSKHSEDKKSLSIVCSYSIEIID
jgi:hypothetical protein